MGGGVAELIGIYTCNLVDNIHTKATNQYTRGKFNLVNQWGSCAHCSSTGAFVFDEPCYAICLGTAVFQQVVQGDKMHCLVHEVAMQPDPNGGRSLDWHGQCNCGGPYDQCTLSASLLKIDNAYMCFPWCMCEQGFTQNHMSKNSIFTFLIFRRRI